MILAKNYASLLIEYEDEPDLDAFTFDIELTVECPDFHTMIQTPLNTTLVENPTIYYDTLQPMIVPMNFWSLDPWSEYDNIVCFLPVQHRFIETATGLAVDYITVSDFE